jgi:membrane dipeptidase
MSGVRSHGAVVIDGHNDLLLRLWRGEEPRHLDLDRAVENGFAGGFFAVFVPGGPVPEDPPEVPYALPLPAAVERAEARRIALELFELLEGLDVRIARSVDDFAPGRVTAIAHFEGAEPLAPDLSDLDEWYERGLRSLGLVWSRPNAFAEGVPFAFPSSPDTGPGLTAAGGALVARCAELGIAVDLSHLNEAGFWDVARLDRAPLIASHSGVHALSPSSRNLTDAQIDAIGASGGLVGVVFAVKFLRADGADDPATPLSTVVAHVRHVADRIGVAHVALGSDFDGATVPAALGDVTGLPRLLGALRDDGFTDDELELIAWGNWRRVLERAWSG